MRRNYTPKGGRDGRAAADPRHRRRLPRQGRLVVRLGEGPRGRRHGTGDLEEMLDDAADTAIRDMEGAGLDIITDGEVRRLDGYVDSYYAIIKGIEPLPVRRKVGPVGLRPADALRGDGTHRDAAGRARHRQGVRVPEGPHHPPHQGHVRGPAHVRLAHPSRQALPGRGGRGRALRGGHQRGAEGTGRRGRRLHPARRAGPRQRLRARRWRGSSTWPPRACAQACLPRLLRQPLRPLALRSPLSPVLPRAARRARRAVRAGVRGARARRSSTCGRNSARAASWARA